ncbi:methyltransferase family protein [Zhihengliuella salsuginis]|uniref:methyltransferase family protein n=1 Tax=Zhihengliuella salsuginis TaxID=578222 RepID=UPI00167C2B7B|nr:isoprenylcysteine carboxylmethyltransferase family protein [Zhihengliuella salsuginis]
MPLPQPHLVALGVAAVVETLARKHIVVPPLRFAGYSTVGAGVALAAWATQATAPTDLAEPDRLVSAGPYAISRNPMYVAWTLIYVGLGLARKSVWIFALLPAVLVMTHLTIKREERRLQEKFGPRYVAYAEKVRRYI